MAIDGGNYDYESDTTTFPKVKQRLGELLLSAPEVKVPEWQSLDVSDRPQGTTHELRNAVFEVQIPETAGQAQRDTNCNLPWAEDHFLERVSGKPLNPPPSAAWWPFAQKGNEEHKKDEKFSHTYPERFWPKHAGEGVQPGDTEYCHMGIRFNYGDLRDVVNQLRESPYTRQAYLPVFFPEDTGAVHGERVPCSLGYHFLIREGKLFVTYFIRSVDFLRHFPDDVYMAMRLGQWVRDNLDLGWPVLMGHLNMHMVSLHVFGGDMKRMEQLYG